MPIAAPAIIARELPQLRPVGSRVPDLGLFAPVPPRTSCTPYHHPYPPRQSPRGSSTRLSSPSPLPRPTAFTAARRDTATTTAPALSPPPRPSTTAIAGTATATPQRDAVSVMRATFSEFWLPSTALPPSGSRARAGTRDAATASPPPRWPTTGRARGGAPGGGRPGRRRVGRHAPRLRPPVPYSLPTSPPPPVGLSPPPPPPPSLSSTPLAPLCLGRTSVEGGGVVVFPPFLPLFFVFVCFLHCPSRSAWYCTPAAFATGAAVAASLPPSLFLFFLLRPALW